MESLVVPLNLMERSPVLARFTDNGTRRLFEFDDGRGYRGSGNGEKKNRKGIRTKREEGRCGSKG